MAEVSCLLGQVTCCEMKKYGMRLLQVLAFKCWHFGLRMHVPNAACKMFCLCSTQKLCEAATISGKSRAELNRMEKASPA